MGTGKASDGERRQATVLFADISGFTALSEKMDPEDVTSFINRCFEVLERIVFSHGGTVNKYLGDCIMALFGLAPTSADPTVEAVRTALEVRDAVHEINRTTTLPGAIDVHVGINSGPVLTALMGIYAQRELAIMGETVDLAMRLEDLSDKGQIFVGPHTYRETSNEFEYRPLPPLVIENDAQPVPIYELIAARPAKRIVRDSERRQATMMFADISSLRALSEHLSADEMMRLLNACFSEMAATVARHGGVIDKYVGECMMALFGVPNAIEDAPKRAVNAAIEIRNRLSRLSEDERLPYPVEPHIGISTGLVIAGEIGGRVKRTYTVMGDSANLASRLKDAAALGSIYVSSDTYRYTRDAFAYRTLDPLTLKGKAEPVQAYEVLSVTEHVHRAKVAGAERMIFSEMVGREQELGRITKCLFELLDGRGGIISLSGEAGLGKSRLLAEVTTRVASMDVTMLEGRSLSIGQSLSFHPFIDLLRHWATISEDDPEVQAASKLEEAIAALFPDQVSEIFPFIASLMGFRLSGAHADRLTGIDGDALQRLIFKTVRVLFEAIATRRPLLLVFEDLHWADLSSVTLLESLLRLVTDHRILFINVFRPQFPDTADRISRAARAQYAAQHVEIALEGLDVSHTKALIRNLLNMEDPPPAIRKLIGDKAEGNPFYIEEVVRSLIDQGAIEYHEGRFRVTTRIDAVVIPGTIQDVIMARVDRLEESARQVLQVASVIGRSFYHQIITRIVEREAELGQALELLKEKQLLLERRTRWGIAIGDRTLAEEIEYVFQHALVQDTIYQSILLKTRKELHAKVAVCIERLFAAQLPDVYGLLAYHYTRAERLEPAHEYSFKAGESALRAAASAEALTFFEEAARLYTLLHGERGDPKHRAALEKNIGLALLNRGSLTESIPHFDGALEYLGEPVAHNTIAMGVRWIIDLTAVLFHIYLRPAQHRGVHNLEHEREVCELFYYRGRAELTSDATRLFLHLPTGLRRFNRIDPKHIDQACGMYVSCAGIFAYSGISFAVSKRMLGIAQTLVRDGNIIDLFVYRAMRFYHHYLQGNWNEPSDIDERLIAEALRYGQLWDVGTFVGIQGEKDIDQGNWTAARQQIAKAAQLVEVYGFDFARSNELALTAYLLLEQRQLDAALYAIERYQAERSERLFHLLALGTKAKIQILMDDRAGATASLNAARAVFAELGQAPPFHQRPYLLARFLFDVSNLERAQTHGHSRTTRAAARAAKKSGRRALAISRKLARMRPETFRYLGEYQWLLGKHLAAVGWWERSIREAERLGSRPDLARGYLEAGRRILHAPASFAAPPGLDARGCLEKARALCVELDLQWDLQQLQAAESLAADIAPTVPAPRVAAHG
jgi:class 3 adenylate cyclase